MVGIMIFQRVVQILSLSLLLPVVARKCPLFLPNTGSAPQQVAMSLFEDFLSRLAEILIGAS